MERKWWTLIAVSVAIFMLLLDITVVNVALPEIQRSLHSSFQDLQWVVNAYSLTLAAFLLDGRRAGRSLRTKARVHDGPRRLHALLGRLRAGQYAARAEPVPRGAGHGRGDDVRHLAGADRARLPRPRARHRLRHLRRRDRRRRRRRPGRRRRDHLGHRLGMDLLRQRADRDRRRVPHAHAGLRVARPRSARRRLARARDLLGLAVPARLRADRGQRKGLGLDARSSPS